MILTYCIEVPTSRKLVVVNHWQPFARFMGSAHKSRERLLALQKPPPPLQIRYKRVRLTAVSEVSRRQTRWRWSRRCLRCSQCVLCVLPSPRSTQTIVENPRPSRPSGTIMQKDCIPPHRDCGPTLKNERIPLDLDGASVPTLKKDCIPLHRASGPTLKNERIPLDLDGASGPTLKKECILPRRALGVSAGAGALDLIALRSTAWSLTVSRRSHVLSPVPLCRR